MAMSTKTLKLLASKVGLGDEEKVLNKAAEFLRLLETKSTAGSNLSDTSKIVICLDLASALYNVNIDIKSAIKCSGLKPSAYTNSKKFCENLLDLNSEKLSTSLLCTVLQSAEAQELADNMLIEYMGQSKMELDLNLPQYVCMAVYQACRIKKIKVSKSKIIEKSRLTNTQWSKLDADWTKFVDLHFAEQAKLVKKKKGKLAKIAMDKVETEDKMETDDTQKQDEIQPELIESYDDWKKRMLEIAYRELKELQKTEKSQRNSVTPRKSPRKASQKFSPYKSPSKTPIKNNGVRLLFPIDL